MDFVVRSSGHSAYVIVTQITVSTSQIVKIVRKDGVGWIVGKFSEVMNAKGSIGSQTSDTR